MVKDPPANARDVRDDPWVGEIPWRRAWEPTPVFLSGESQGQRTPGGYSPWGHKESDATTYTSFLLSLCLTSFLFFKKKIISTFFLSSYHFLLEFWLPRIWLFGLECYCSTLKSTESVNMLGSIASFPIKQLLNTTL